MLQLPSERIWPSQLVQRHSAATWRHDSLAASTIEAGHHPRSAEMSAATKYAPQAATATVGRTVAPRQRGGEGRPVEAAGGPPDPPLNHSKGCFFNK